MHANRLAMRFGRLTAPVGPMAEYSTALGIWARTIVRSMTASREGSAPRLSFSRSREDAADT